jgi:hypothetical protein
MNWNHVRTKECRSKGNKSVYLQTTVSKKNVLLLGQ